MLVVPDLSSSSRPLILIIIIIIIIMTGLTFEHFIEVGDVVGHPVIIVECTIRVTNAILRDNDTRITVLRLDVVQHVSQ